MNTYAQMAKNKFFATHQQNEMTSKNAQFPTYQYSGMMLEKNICPPIISPEGMGLNKKHIISKDNKSPPIVNDEYIIDKHNTSMASLLSAPYDNTENTAYSDYDAELSKEIFEALKHKKFSHHEGNFMPDMINDSLPDNDQDMPPLHDLSGNDHNVPPQPFHDLSDHGSLDSTVKADNNIDDLLTDTMFKPLNFWYNKTLSVQQQDENYDSWAKQNEMVTKQNQMMAKQNQMMAKHDNKINDDEITIEFGNEMPTTQPQIPKLPFPLATYFKAPQDFHHNMNPIYISDQSVHTQSFKKEDKTKTYKFASHFETEAIDCIDTFLKLTHDTTHAPDNVSGMLGALPLISLFGPNKVRHTMFYKTMIPFDCGKPSGQYFDINLSAVREQTGIDLLNDCFLVFPKKVDIKCIYLCSGDIDRTIDKIQGELLPILQSLKYENSYDDFNDDEYIVPLPFFFKKTSSAFPLVATPYSSLNLKIITHTPMDEIGNIKLIASGIFLSITERQRFIDLPTQTIITQWGMNHIKANLQDVKFPDGEETTETTIYIPINSFSSCVSQMFIKVFSENDEYIANMSGTVLKSGKPYAFIDSTINKLNFAKYNVTCIPKNTYVIPFCVYPDMASQQSSGFVRMSSDMVLKLTFKISSRCVPKKMSVHVWCPRYNILRVNDGTFSV